MTADPQALFDTDNARSFRALTRRLAAKIRVHRTEEAKLKEAWRELRKARRAAEEALEEHTEAEADAGDDRTWAEQERRLYLAVQTAQGEEAGGFNEWKERVLVRRREQGALQDAIRGFSEHLPLFDGLPQPSGENAAKPKKARKPKLPPIAPEAAKAIHEHLCPNGPQTPLPAAPVTRATLLDEIVPGQTAEPAYAEACAALDRAGLASVGDLLDRAAATPKKIAAGEDWIDGHASVYDVLHAVGGLPRAAALAIGDRVIDAGLLPRVVDPYAVSVPVPHPPVKAAVEEIGKGKRRKAVAK